MRLSISRDTNGNRTMLVKVKGQRGFTIQTLGNLPNTHRNGSDVDHELSKAEVIAFVSTYGTNNQKSKLGLLA